MAKSKSEAKASLNHDTEQSRSMAIDPTVTLGDVKIDPNQSRSLGLPLRSCLFDRIDRENPFVRMVTDHCNDRDRGQREG